ncbi:histidinol-phosphate transaminase [Allomuricauda sp. SCSIO 65647]|uniref:histidinol-phosphate transaminase n=1 Tax=Allomuricauda sp. SCSIO 65647 TaxID=2908843 RepID=UPI001F44EDC1|nr:histidinol-phosphate transaminase [Muricauda sp. SCSIO 65647]UJH67244.1 histidinol-phosphate transaminase [Muricauda sp. SCSIO 65647]
MMKFTLDGLVRENVKSLKPYSSARDEYLADGSQMVFLDANENPFENGMNRYPDPHQRSVKNILADLKGIPESQILVGNGSDEVLDLLFRAFCEPKVDNVIILPPTYGMYKVLGGINEIRVKEVLLTNDFQPNTDQVLDTVDGRTKLIFLCSPNNPTANSFETAHIEQVLKGFNGLLVIDEAYIDFSKKESWISKLGTYPNLIVTQTLSKAYGMAGIRMGVCYASEAIIAILKKIKPPYNVNELTQQQAKKGLLDQKGLEKQVNAILGQREVVRQTLYKIGFVREVFPSDANFLLTRVDDADRRYTELLQKGIVARNRSTQPLCENTLRFTIGTAEENKHLINALNELDNE